MDEAQTQKPQAVSASVALALHVCLLFHKSNLQQLLKHLFCGRGGGAGRMLELVGGWAGLGGIRPGKKAG